MGKMILLTCHGLVEARHNTEKNTFSQTTIITKDLSLLCVLKKYLFSVIFHVNVNAMKL